MSIPDPDTGSGPFSMLENGVARSDEDIAQDISHAFCDDWRSFISNIRRIAAGLADRGALVVSQFGVVVAS